MKTSKLYPQRWYDKLLGYFFRFAASGFLPARWFRDRLPDENERQAKTGRLNLEIVSHCWGYSNMLAYQLSSFINYPPSKLNLTVTAFYAREDTDTCALLEFIGQHCVPNVTWNWQLLPKPELFRRGVGRNRAARNTLADWLWFTDCDIIFHENCLDSLAEQLQGKQGSLYFPRQERTTPMLASEDPMLQKSRVPQVVNIDADKFSLFSRDRAKGAFQVVHGDVARAIGYCEGISLYQTPADHWCKCYEDRAFRWLIDSHGIPIEVDGVFQIRHIYKGRYKENSGWSKLRSKIRRIQE